MIPIGDSPRSRTTPWMNYALIVANVAVFIYMLSLPGSPPPTGAARQALAASLTEDCYGLRQVNLTEVDDFVCRWSFQPGEFFDAAKDQLRDPNSGRVAIIFSIITAAFLHAGWFHIAGNMLFLWVFGDNVEDRLGHLAYLGFYLLAAAVAAVVQGLIDTTSIIPNVGASGGVAGVLGAYLVMYPKAVVSVVIPFFILIFIPIPVPAVIMIGLWFLQNLLSGFASISGAGAADQGVAFFAHIGGFVFGMVVAFFFVLRPSRAPPRWP